MSGFASQRRLASVLSVAALTGACSVADSFHVEPAAIHASAYSTAVPTLCRSALGSYALPKSFLRIVVQRPGEGPPELVAPTTVVRADKSLTFCLDHIADPLADDDIRIIKSSGQLDPSYGEVDPKKADPTKVTVGQYKDAGNKDYGSQLLQWVVSNTVDQSEYIAKTLIRTAFTALSGKSNFTPLGRAKQNPGDPAPAKVTIASFEYDPFDPEQSALHNSTLRDLGYCLVLENFTFDMRAMTVEQYCSAPRYVSFPFDEAYATYRSGPPPRIAGVAYRPRIDYALSVYKNDNPKGRGRWRLSEQHRVKFENIAPIVSIGLNRSVFAARRVALKFNMGALESMCLVKTSELQSAVMVPYEIAKSIVALPTQIFEVKIGNISDNVELLSAESKVVKAQQEYLDFLADATKHTFTNSTEKKVVPLPGKDSPDKLPNPIAVTVDKAIVGNLASLSSSVLDQICQNAPTFVAPTARAGTP